MYFAAAAAAPALSLSTSAVQIFLHSPRSLAILSPLSRPELGVLFFQLSAAHFFFFFSAFKKVFPDENLQHILIHADRSRSSAVFFSRVQRAGSGVRAQSERKGLCPFFLLREGPVRGRGALFFFLRAA